MDWNLDYRYKLLGKVIHANGEWLIAFDLTATEIYQRILKDGTKPRSSRTPVFPEGWQNQFGLPFKEHQKSMQIDIFEGYAVYGIRGQFCAGQPRRRGCPGRGLMRKQEARHDETKERRKNPLP